MKQNRTDKSLGIHILGSLALTLVLVFFITAGASFMFTKTERTTLPIQISNNTAQQWKLTPSYGIDSFGYECTLVSLPAGSEYDSLAIEYLGPVTTFIVTPTFDTATTYLCSMAYDTDTVGIAYNPHETATNLESLIDSLVAKFNAAAGVGDSVTAQDSVTYIKIVADYAMISFGGDNRPALIIDTTSTTAGATGTLTKDSTIVTVAAVVDTIVAIINGDDSLSPQVTAYDSGTFVFIVADTAGHGFFIEPVDTSMDTTHTTANVNGASTFEDTIKLANLWTGGRHPKGMLADFILYAPTDTGKGTGLTDSGSMWLHFAKQVGPILEYYRIDSIKQNDLPCTLSYALTTDHAGSDTLMKDQAYLVYRYYDTASDTNATLHGTLTINLRVMQEQ